MNHSYYEGYVVFYGSLKDSENSITYFSENATYDWCYDSDIRFASIFSSIKEAKEILEEIGIKNDQEWQFKSIKMELKYELQ